ncbi:MAG: SRPBCC domain-containing protein [Bacteroidetes bacterium]|nr:SRPBCC domain-containing protein [Bacteroidota bacterium]
MYCIKHLYHISTSKEEVFKALTTIKGLSQWWTEQTSGNPIQDGIIEFRFGEVHFFKMEVEALIENKVVEWKCIDGPDDWINTIITFELDANENKTRLRFKHNNWPTDGDFFAHCSFSWAGYLESLRLLLEKGKGQPFKP